MIAALALAVTLAAGPPAPAAPAPDAAALARRVQSLYERTRDLEARFTQTYVYAGLGRRLVSTGTVRVKKPGRMRWDYATPEPKTVAVVGKRLVQYEPEARQAYVDEAFDSSALSAAVTFLLGTGDLAREFELGLGTGGELVLKPRKPDPRVVSIALTVGPDGEVTASRVTDAQGNENRIELAGIRRDAGLADAAFEVDLPKGVRRLEPPR